MFRVSRISVTCTGLLGLAAMFVAPLGMAQDEATSAEAATGSIHASGCLLWDLSGDLYLAYDPGVSSGNWGLDLARAVLPPSMKLQQSGNQLRGSIIYPKVLSDTPIGSGTVIGTISGDTFQITATWRYTEQSDWNFVQTRIYDGQITRDGVISGIVYNNVHGPGHSTPWHTEGKVTCKSKAASVYDSKQDHGAVTAAVSSQPRVAFARIDTSNTPTRPICDSARSARARNSPAAPGLEKQCLAAGGSMAAPAPAPVAGPDLDALAAIGAAIAEQDPAVAEARESEAGAFYQLGFDIASGLFGDPALGSAGNTLMGPGSESIRNSLSAAGQRGFNASVQLHLARDYKN